MSIFKSSTSITKYKVSGIPFEGMNDIMTLILQKFEQNSIKDIPDGEDICWGWTNMISPFEQKFNDMSFMSGDYITVGLRIDTKKVPSAAIDKEVFLKEKEYIEQNQLQKIPRATRIMIKESVTKNMLKTAPIVPKDFNIIWNVAQKKLYLLTTNTMARSVLEDIMKESFDLDIKMMFPFTMSICDEINEKDIEQLKQTQFF